MMKNDSVLLELKYILDIFQTPLLGLLQNTDALVNQNLTNGATLSALFQALKSMLQIIYSLCSVDLPAYIEDNLNVIMTLFRKYLLFETSLVELVGDPVSTSIITRII
jgi:hypothetical protein